MAHPSEFVANSDFASTPASLAGAVELTLTTPTNIQLQEYVPTTLQVEQTLDGDFDSFVAYLSMDGKDEIQINDRLGMQEIGTYSVFYCWAKVEMLSSRKVALKAVFSSFSNTSTGNISHTFKAIVIPIKAPYQA